MYIMMLVPGSVVQYFTLRCWYIGTPGPTRWSPLAVRKRLAKYRRKETASMLLKFAYTDNLYFENRVHINVKCEIT